MTLQVLISTMFKKDYSLLEKMRVDSNCVVVNQTNYESLETFNYNGNKVIWINSLDRGLSKSRNLALKYCTDDIVLLADDDEILNSNYKEIIIKEFEQSCNADLLCFNIHSIDNVRQRYINKNKRRLGFLNIFRYGSARIAFKLDFLKRNKIVFNEKFGAGTENGGGEDSLFLYDFLRNKALCYSSSKFIADIDDSKSTWFRGYNDDYFINLGKFYYTLKKNLYLILIFIVLLKRKSITKKKGFFKCYKLMCQGAKIAKETS